ncbi:MAG: enoyl-CoA hydratase/isomerase family protein [Gammaproteobacteria bacterium]|nr:enoyl-CoA hydratase/isomerase family protein [Gammaproteobacteria bacterium]
MTDSLLVERHGAVLNLTINRPEKRNALSLALLDEIGAAMAAHAGDAGIKCAVLTGAGDRCFAAGGDLQELDAVRDEAGTRAMSRRGRAALDQVRAFPVPVIAALNGHAFGGGAELAVACDLRVAAPHAEIGFLQAQLAVTTAWGGSIDLALTVGDRRALRILATSARLEAARALDLGLVDWVCAPGQPLDACLATFLEPYLARSRAVLAGFKATTSAERRRAHVALAPQEEEHFVRTWTHADHWAAMAQAAAKPAPR